MVVLGFKVMTINGESLMVKSEMKKSAVMYSFFLYMAGGYGIMMKKAQIEGSFFRVAIL